MTVAAIDVSTTEPGWLLVPEFGSTSERAAWVAQRLEELEAASPEQIPWAHREVLGTLLEVADDRRRDDDDYLFQVWPLDVPACAFVHVACGVLPDDAYLPGPGDGLLYDASELGQGVQIPYTEEMPEGEALGMRFLFVQGRDAVIVDVEPTSPVLLAGVMPGMHGLLQSLKVTRSNGSRFVADPPNLLEAASANQWVMPHRDE